MAAPQSEGQKHCWCPAELEGPTQTAYGSYQLSNAWPDRLSAEQTVYLDQFTGRTLARSDTSSFGAIGQVTWCGGSAGPATARAAETSDESRLPTAMAVIGLMIAMVYPL